MYLDSSGDEGFKLGSAGNASSKFYVVAGLVFYDPGPAIRNMHRLQERLGMPPDAEFKFSQLKSERRHAFFGLMGSSLFNAYALVVPKDALHSKRLREQGIEFRREFCMQFLRVGCKLTEIRAIIDDMESTEQQHREAREYLMREVNRDVPNKLVSVAFVKSHDYQLVQAADMCAGAIRAAREGKPAYRELIADKIANEWRWE